MSYPRLPAQGGQPRDVARAVNHLLGIPANLTNAVDDAAAATAGVQVGELYHNAGAVRVRLT